MGMPSGPVFVIPTYRLRDVNDTVKAYDENFTRNGQPLDIVIFDDSSIANHDTYFSLLEATTTHRDVWYVGPHEKGKFTDFLLGKLRNRKHEGLVNNLFRPSYGGNRNYTLIYTLGRLMISSDDDMRPEGLIAHGNESLLEQEVARGILSAPDGDGCTVVQYDFIQAMMEVLGKKVREAPKHYARGRMIRDSAMTLETNTTTGYTDHNTLVLEEGPIRPGATIKAAQTFRTGTADFDAIDFAEMFLREDRQLNPLDLSKVYVLQNFRPALTDLNWRMDCGVAGYDNRHGLPPFFPTRLRFEDYVYRLWMQRHDLASAHVNAVQRHLKNSYMREPLASDILNEEITTMLKHRIKDSVTRIGDFTIDFAYDGEVTRADTDAMLERASDLHTRVMEASVRATGERQTALLQFADNVQRYFYGFEHDFFLENVSRLVDDEIHTIKSTMSIWEDILQICYHRKDIKPLPMRRVKNKRK
ncbi:MAG: hypothetical protein ABIH41_03130 [Nanoarchaeota archaeon]